MSFRRVRSFQIISEHDFTCSGSYWPSFKQYTRRAHECYGLHLTKYNKKNILPVTNSVNNAAQLHRNLLIVMFLDVLTGEIYHPEVLVRRGFWRSHRFRSSRLRSEGTMTHGQHLIYSGSYQSYALVSTDKKMFVRGEAYSCKMSYYSTDLRKAASSPSCLMLGLNTLIRPI